MLNFLRKYQKIVFGAVTAALILSLSLFGSTGDVGEKRAKEVDKVIGTAIDGSSVSKLHIDKMTRFLATDCFDLDGSQNKVVPNFFNNGVIRRDFLETGLANMLVSEYFSEIQQDLQARLQKQKKFKLYSHPQAPFLSAEAIYAQFLPSVQKNLEEIRRSDFVLSKETFPILSEMYVNSTRFPVHYLRQFLSYQESQYEGIQKDPYIREGDLNLFYFHGVEDWFGPNFVELISQFVHNAAIFAKQKGYKVSYEEARSDLFRIGYESLKQYAGEKEITPEVLGRSWKQQLDLCRLDEKAAVSIWQEVLLFRKVFEDFGGSIFLDTLSYEQFEAYASEGMEVKLYTLPSEYKISDFNSFLKFQAYVEAVARDEKAARSLDLIDEFKPISSLEKSAPELLERVYEVEIAHVTSKEAAKTISLKETWAFEENAKNFDKIKSNFKELQAASVKTDADRMKALESLNDKVRLEVDEFARKEILKTKQDVIAKVLQDKPLQTKTLALSLGKEISSLDGVLENAALISLLDLAPSKELVDLSEEQKKVSEKLNYFTQDGENYYKIHVVKKPLETKLLSFREASSKKILDTIVEAKLKKFLPQAKAAEPALFQNENGSAKEFALVKEDIGRLLYKDLLKAIESDLTKLEKKMTSQKDSLNFLARHRFYHYMKGAKEDIEHLGEESLYLDQTRPFHLKEATEKVKRKQKEYWVEEATFQLAENVFSNLKVAENGDMTFYQVLKKEEPSREKLLEEIKEGQSLIASDAKKYLMAELIDEIHKTDSIHLEKI